MKIGLVLSNIPAYSETFFRNKILGLQRNGYQVVLFINDSRSVNNYLNCKIIKSPNLGGNKFRVAINSLVGLMRVIFLNPKRSLTLFKLNQKDKIPFNQNIKQIISNQFLLSEKLDWLHFGFATMVLGRENISEAIGATMAISFRGYDYYVYPIKNDGCYVSLFSKKAKYHVLSDAMKEGLESKGILKENITKITPAIDTNLFKESIHEQDNTIIQIKTISRLHPIKGLDYALESLRLLKRQNIPFHFTIIGDGMEKERLQFAVYQLNLSENVSFLGKLSQEKVKEELSTTDIYLQYSIQEGFCNAVLEAQAMGLLCAVSDAEGLSENVLDTKTGWVIPKRKPELLAKKIKEIINLSTYEKNIVRDNAVQRVQSEFNLEKQEKEFVNFYSL